MSIPATPSPTPSGDDRNLVRVDETYVAPGFEDRLRIFWEKNSKTVMTVCVVVLVAIIAKGGWELLQAQKEKGIAADYAAAGNDSAKLKSFASSHEGHALAGASYLRLADEAYAAGKFADAAANYEKAAADLKEGPFAGRVRLGLAVSKLQSGNAAGAEADLKVLANDVGLLKAVRAEAAYHLATIAAGAGKNDEVAKLADQIMTIDPQGTWSQRAMMLRATLPAADNAAAVPAPAPEKKEESTPAVSFKPGGE